MAGEATLRGRGGAGSREGLSEFRGVIGATGWSTGRLVGLDLRIGGAQLGGQERRACSEASGIWEGVSIAVGSGRGRGGQTPAHPAMWRWTGCPETGSAELAPGPDSPVHLSPLGTSTVAVNVHPGLRLLQPQTVAGAGHPQTGD